MVPYDLIFVCFSGAISCDGRGVFQTGYNQLQTFALKNVSDKSASAGNRFTVDLPHAVVLNEEVKVEEMKLVESEVPVVNVENLANSESIFSVSLLVC